MVRTLVEEATTAVSIKTTVRKNTEKALGKQAIDLVGKLAAIDISLIPQTLNDGFDPKKSKLKIDKSKSALESIRYDSSNGLEVVVRVQFNYTNGGLNHNVSDKYKVTFNKVSTDVKRIKD
jgi:hypothetical protein